MSVELIYTFPFHTKIVSQYIDRLRFKSFNVKPVAGIRLISD